ncbi:DUF6299 family protein [Embleya sp. NPDC005971]|uniref:DUF6299 family protein n=1 Tax=Embleya sp. NPDC005971 TaxID=3156724 RepID=UPI0033D0F1E5
MMITVGRAAAALSAGIAGLLLALAPVAARAAESVHVGGDRVLLDSTVWVAADGTITLSGTYQCSAGHAGVVLVGGSVGQAGHHTAVGGSIATCDGRAHAWRNSEKSAIGFVPGAAHGDATLLELEDGEGVVPVLPAILAVDDHDVVIQRA